MEKTQQQPDDGDDDAQTEKEEEEKGALHRVKNKSLKAMDKLLFVQ